MIVLKKTLVFVFCVVFVLACISNVRVSALEPMEQYGYFNWVLESADWPLRLVVPFAFDGGRMVVFSDPYLSKMCVVAVSSDTNNYESWFSVTDTTAYVFAGVGVEVRYTFLDVPLPPEPGNAWDIIVPDSYQSYTIEQNPNNMFASGEFSLEVGFNAVQGLRFNANVGVGGSLNSTFFELLYYPPSVISVNISQETPSPIYPGTTCQMAAEVNGPGDFDEAVTWSVSGLDPETTIDENGLVTIGRGERMSVIVRATSVQDPTIYAEYELPVSWPTDQMQIAPSTVYDLPLSSKERILYFRLETPEGSLFLGTKVEWSVVTSAGAEDYFTINPNNGALTVKSNAPVGATATVYWRYTVGGEEYETLRTNGAGVEIVPVDQAITDQLTPTPEQSEKAEDLENGIRDEAASIENNNSTLEQLTPSRPVINTDLTLDPVFLTSASPLIANIWSISGMGRIIGVVLAVATVAYIFFGKRDG